MFHWIIPSYFFITYSFIGGIRIIIKYNNVVDIIQSFLLDLVIPYHIEQNTFIGSICLSQ